MSNYLPEIKQRIDAAKRLEDLALSTMETHRNPVVLLSLTLQELPVFLPDEVVGFIQIILDATLQTQGAHCE